MVARLDKLAPPDAVVIAALFFALKERDEGFHWLTRAVDERQIRARFLNVWPLFDEVRSDPRFVALVKRLKLPA